MYFVFILHIKGQGSKDSDSGWLLTKCNSHKMKIVNANVYKDLVFDESFHYVDLEFASPSLE